MRNRILKIIAITTFLLLGQISGAAGADFPLYFYLDGATVTFPPEARNIYRYLFLNIPPPKPAETVFASTTSAFFISDPLGLETLNPARFDVIVWLKASSSNSVLRGRVVKLTANFRPNLGDLNCDGAVDENDIHPFVLALVDEGRYQKEFPHCQRTNADTNQDGAVNNFDIDRFVALLKRPPLTLICETEQIVIGATQRYERYPSSCLSNRVIDFEVDDKLALVLVPESEQASYSLSTGVKRTDGYSRMEVHLVPDKSSGNGITGGGGGAAASAPNADTAAPPAAGLSDNTRAL